MPAKPPNARHGPRRMLAMMEAYGTITPAMRQAGLDLRAVMMTGSRPVLLLLGLLGIPAAACVVHQDDPALPMRRRAVGDNFPAIDNDRPGTGGFHLLENMG